MNLEERLSLIREVGEEIVTEEELKKLLSEEKTRIAYDGFEPSGQMHIAQGIVRAINVNKMVKAGFKFKILVADWHAMANKKLGGDLEKIKTVGKYFIEVWRAVGMDQDNVEFVWASDLVKDPRYWMVVLEVAKTNSYKRFIRTAEIMGRAEDENITGAQIIYSCMQTADIFILGARVTQLGLDQRKVNVLAREVGPQLSPPAGGWKPVIVSHHMLMGLKHYAHSHVGSPTTKKREETIQQAIQYKMSKSDPDSAIFMTDTEEDIKRKINKAYCPEGEIKGNPILEYLRYIVFESFDKITVERPKKFGGTIQYESYSQLAEDYAGKKIHPADLKTAVTTYLNKLLEPVRIHFENNPYARTLLDQVKSYKITR